MAYGDLWEEVPPCFKRSGGQGKNDKNGQLDVREAGHKQVWMEWAGAALQLWQSCVAPRPIHSRGLPAQRPPRFPEPSGSLTKWQQGQEMEPGDEEQDRFNTLYYQDAMSLGLEDIAGGKGAGFGKGKGKGKRQRERKRQGKGFGKGKKQLAIKDKEGEKKKKKRKKMKRKKMKRNNSRKLWKRQGKQGAQCPAHKVIWTWLWKRPAQSWAGRVRLELRVGQANLPKFCPSSRWLWGAKRKTTSSDLKALLEESAKLVKGAKDEAKGLKQLANKEASLAGWKQEV